MNIRQIIANLEVEEQLPAVAGAFGRQHSVAPATSLTWTVRGLRRLIGRAQRFAERAGISLPHNLKTDWTLKGGPRYYKEDFDIVRFDQRDEAVTSAARFAGWLRAAAGFPALVRLINQTGAGDRGMGSPYRSFEYYTMSEMYSPGALDRTIRKVRERAEDFLGAYGLHVSSAAIATALCHNRGRVGKIAREAAANTVVRYLRARGVQVPHAEDIARGWWGDNPDTHKQDLRVLIYARGLRAWMLAAPGVQRWVASQLQAGKFSCLREAVEASTHLVADATDGVVLMLDPTTATRRFGVEVVLGWDNTPRQRSREGNYVTVLLRQVGTGRSYHASRWPGVFDQPGALKTLVQEAITAWRRQAEMEREHRPLLSIFETDKVSHLVLIDDSFSAGNCRPGTEDWLSNQGWGARKFVRAADLLKAGATNQRVINTLNAAVRRIQQMQA